MQERRIVVVRNPTSGRGAGARHWPLVESLLAHRGRVETHATAAPGDAGRIAREAAAYADIVVAAGGDGTINEVATGLSGTGGALGVIPLGTGNDFARALGLGRDLPLAVETLFQGEARPVDVGTWACDGRQGTFINVAGCGFDAVVAERINRGFRRLRGTSAYLAAVLSTLRTYRAARLRLQVDDTSLEDDAMLCAIANATSYGGGMRVAPDALLDDGLLDVVWVQGVGRVEFLRAFPRVFRGTHTTHPKVRVLRGREISIESEPPLPVLADGELVGTTPVTFGIQPGALRVLFPVGGS